MQHMSFGYFFRKKEKKRIYLDYAAATPMREVVRTIIHKHFKEVYGNASAIHREGALAKSRLEESRLRLARLLKVRPQGIIFTGSGTESNNLALLGLLERLEVLGTNFADMEVISTPLEHPSVGEVLTKLTERGVRVHMVNVGEDGRIDVEQLQALLNERTALVTCAYANSEIGVVQDVKRIARVVKQYNTEHQSDIKVHIDAAQAPLWLPCQFDVLGVDMISLDAGKCYGPKGVGVLAMRHGVELSGVLLGGGQEHGLRPGTENVPLILGAVKAFEIAQEEYETRSTKIAALRDTYIQKLLAIEGVVLNGSKEHRIANNINISATGINGEFAVVTLDEKGIAISTKSACSGARGGGSTVVKAISGDEARALSTLRITLGEETTEHELDYFVSTLRIHIQKTRAAHATLTNN